MKTAVLAGYGKLPLIAINNLKDLGHEVITIAFNEEINIDLSDASDKIYKFSVGQAKKVLDTLEKEKVESVLFAGKINKSLLYSNLKFDMFSIKLLMSLKDRKDDTIMLKIVELLEERGIKVLEQTEILKNLLIEEGGLTKLKPNKDEWDDIRFGFNIAKELGRVDIGQTVVVKNMAVMAVEAIEGTDEAIKRGCNYAKKDAVVVKVAKPFQDFRFDVPTVGIDTLKNIKDNKGKVLALEAGKTFIIDKEECIKFADKNKMIIVGIRGENEG
ncbi:UDP-2,3-diacylglucosamine diphosphatase LpxI [Deferribacter thermophilus]|uniref:LpxI family protein n=1 Tax=Deferribacter thermophilus TaxID=53573 RepID=UPI003C2A3D12